MRRILDFLSSLKLTMVCLVAALILVFVGTIAQVDYGLHEVQERYFQSLFVWWPVRPQGWHIPVFPGGHLIGAVLLINLITAHLRRFRMTWGKLGIHLTHFGLIIMLAGGLFTDLFAVESFMRLSNGETKNYSEDARRMELAVIDQTAPELDSVTAIPEALLRKQGTIEHSSLPFELVVRKFYQNCQLQMLGQAGPGAKPAATQGIGSRVAVTEASKSAQENNLISCVIEVLSKDGQSLGTWLLSDALGAPQVFSFGGKSWRMVLRSARYYKPYSLTLQKFTHERYAGTEIAKNFASSVTLIDPTRNENRDVLIYMNHPLRYHGDTYYQSGFDKNDTVTVLQVVHNPTFVAPYVACVVVAIGLLIQFISHFAGFSRHRKSAAAAAPVLS